MEKRLSFDDFRESVSFSSRLFIFEPPKGGTFSRTRAE
jgi:hypothetical protein